MRLVILAIIFACGFVARAESLEESSKFPTEFPQWLTDEKAKLWAVDNLMEFMKDDKFYKIQSIKVKRQFDEDNKCDSMDVKLEFNDPSCEGRHVMLTLLAPLCGDEGCMLVSGLTDCAPESSPSVKTQKFMPR